MISVLVTDDQDLVRTGFRLILDAEPDLRVVGEATNGRQAVERAATLQPDVVLMDIRMPVMDGIAATRVIVERVPAPKVIILTTFDLDELVYGALTAGASGSCSRTSPPRNWPRRSAPSIGATRCSPRPSPAA